MMKILDACSVWTGRHLSGRCGSDANRASLASVVAFLVLASGCSQGDDRLPVFPVKGKVSVAGEIPEGALVVLYPEAGGEGAPRPSGKVRNDGSFALTTYEADDGAPVGDYVATLAWNKVVKSAVGYSAGPNVIPKSYADRSTSVWKVKVAAAPNELDPLNITGSKK